MNNILPIIFSWIRTTGLVIVMITIAMFILIRLVNYLSDKIFSAVREKKKKMKNLVNGPIP